MCMHNAHDQWPRMSKPQQNMALVGISWSDGQTVALIESFMSGFNHCVFPEGGNEENIGEVLER